MFCLCWRDGVGLLLAWVEIQVLFLLQNIFMIIFSILCNFFTINLFLENVYCVLKVSFMFFGRDG